MVLLHMAFASFPAITHGLGIGGIASIEGLADMKPPAVVIPHAATYLPESPSCCNMPHSTPQMAGSAGSPSQEDRFSRSVSDSPAPHLQLLRAKKV